MNTVDDSMKDLDLIDLPPVSPERLAAAKRVMVDLLVEEALVEIQKASAEP